MRIIVKGGSHTDVNLVIPTNLIFNRVSILILQQICKKQNVDFPLSKKQLIDLMKVVRKYKRHHPSWKLVEVESTDGERVEISL